MNNLSLGIRALFTVTVYSRQCSYLMPKYSIRHNSTQKQTENKQHKNNRKGDDYIMAMNKKAFTDRMAAKGNITKAQAKREVELFLGTLVDCMRDGEVVNFRRFGKFEVKTLKEKKARHPHTGEECIVPAHKKIKFHSSEVLSEWIK